MTLDEFLAIHTGNITDHTSAGDKVLISRNGVSLVAPASVFDTSASPISAIYETDKILISRNGVSMAATSNKFIETSALPIATTLSPTDKIQIEHNGQSMVASVRNVRDTNVSVTSVVILGDSISNGGQTGGWQFFSMQKSGGRILTKYNSAVGGETLTQMSARFSTTVAPFAPFDELWIHGGSNSSTNDEIAFDAIIKQAWEIGVTPIVFAIPPGNTAQDQRNLWNQWMFQYCIKNSIRFYNLWSEFFDPTTLGWLSGYAGGDGIHPMQSTHLLAATNYITERFGASQMKALTLPTSINDPLNLWTNPLNLIDTNADGLSDGWIFYGVGSPAITPTLSVNTIPNVGKKQNIRFVSTTVNESMLLYRYFNVVAGEKYRICYYLHSGNLYTNGSTINPIIESELPSTVRTLLHSQTIYADSANGMVTLDVEIPVGAIRLRFGIYAFSKTITCDNTFSLSQLSLRKL